MIRNGSTEPHHLHCDSTCSYACCLLSPAFRQPYLLASPMPSAPNGSYEYVVVGSGAGGGNVAYVTLIHKRVAYHT